MGQQAESELTGAATILVLTGVRAVWGAVLVTAPRMVLRRGSTRPTGVSARLVARLLGVRDLVQAVALARYPSRRTFAAGAVVDSLHSATMLWLAIDSPEHRRLASSSALIAAGFAIVGAGAAMQDHDAPGLHRMRCIYGHGIGSVGS